MTTQHWRGFILCQLLGLGLLASWLFPATRSLDTMGGESEERRLFYVAVTRAKDRLYFCQPRFRRTRDGGIIGYMPSRFIKEIPAALLEHEHPSRW